MTVLVYVNTRKQVGDVDHIKVFATTDTVEAWFEENDPEGVAFEYEVGALVTRSLIASRSKHSYAQFPYYGRRFRRA
jgi:hypothetical protein